MNEALVVCVRGIISYFSLLIFTRMLGKQQIGQITFFDYILGITIGSFAASLTVDLSSSAWPHWVGLLIWVFLGILMQRVSLKSVNLSGYLNDRPIIVIHDGKIIGDNLSRSKFTLNELLAQLRLRDIYDVNNVKLALIETNGGLSILEQDKYMNLVNSIGIKGEMGKLQEIIFNGIIIEDNVKKNNISREWLLDQLKLMGYKGADEIFFSFIDDSGNLAAYSYRDKIAGSRDIFNNRQGWFK